MLQAVQTGFAVSATLELNIYMTPEDLISEFQPPPPLFNLYAIFIHHPAHSTQSLKFMKEIRGGVSRLSKESREAVLKIRNRSSLLELKSCSNFSRVRMDTSSCALSRDSTWDLQRPRQRGVVRGRYRVTTVLISKGLEIFKRCQEFSKHPCNRLQYFANLFLFLTYN